MTATPTALLGSDSGWSDDAALGTLLDAVFTDDAFKTFLTQQIRSQGIDTRAHSDLMTVLRRFFHGNLGWSDPNLRYDLVEQFACLADYERATFAAEQAYNAKSKPNPEAVFWPNPTRDASQDLFQTLPFVEHLDLIGKSTPIGSAGSCFAFEISRELQSRGFNYVVTEDQHDPVNGILSMDPEPDKAPIKFPANWGILFNTPSFRQLAERAFETRSLPRLLLAQKTPDGGTAYTDPFREGLYFTSREAYEADYPRHTAAIRKALETCEYFVLTLGLNECWGLINSDLAIARNPRGFSLQMLARTRVLTVAENVANIQSFLDIVRAHNPGLKLILSVSPIPFLATSRGSDTHVVTANSHSKAVLRVAAEELCNANDGVYYFPSYELITTCMRDPWTEDQRHVTRGAVGRVMELFNEMFVVGADRRQATDTQVSRAANE